MPPRITRQKSKLPQREIDICLRIREAREIADVTQEKLAVLVGIPKDRLSSYEKCRAPLKFDLGLRICRQLIISEEWLATGNVKSLDSEGNPELKELYQRYCYDLLSESITNSIPPGTLFSDAFDKFLKPRYTALACEFPYCQRITLSPEVIEIELSSRIIEVTFQRHLILLGHMARLKKTDYWLVQRNFTSSLFQLSHTLYLRFLELDLDVDNFQSFVRAMNSLEIKDILV